MLTLCAFLMVPSADTLYNFELLCCYFELLCCYLCYSTTAHSAYTPLQLESARLYTTVGARVGLAPSRLPASNTTAGDQRVEGPTTTRPSLPIEGRRQLTSKRQEWERHAPKRGHCTCTTTDVCQKGRKTSICKEVFFNVLLLIAILSDLEEEVINLTSLS